MAGTMRDTRKLRIFCGVAAACWTVPQAAYCVLRFDPWLAPGLFSSPAPPWPLVTYTLLAVLMPVVLLACGLSLAEDRGGWRWLVGWVLMLVIGFTYEVFAVFELHILASQLYDPAHLPWILLGSAAVFVAVALALAATLTDSLRAILTASGAGLAKSVRTPPGRVAVAGTVLAVLVVVALVMAGLRAGLARPGWSVPIDSSTVTAVAFSPDGGSLAVADDAGDVTMQAVDPGTGAPTGRGPYVMTSAGMSSLALAFSPGRHVLALGGVNESGNGEVELWNTVTRRRILSLADPVRQAPVRALAFTADGTVLAAGDDSGVTSLWDARTGRLLERFGTAQLATNPADSITGIDSVAFSPDGSLLATVTYSGGVTLWRTETGAEAGSTLIPSAIGTGGTTAGGTNAIAFSDRDDNRLTIAVGRSGVYLWDAGTGGLRTLVTWPACQSCDYPIALSADGNYALVGGATAQLWDLSSSRVAKAWADPVGYRIASVALGPAGPAGPASPAGPAGPVAFGDTDGGPLVSVTFPVAVYLRP